MSKIIKKNISDCTIIGNKYAPRSGAFEVEIDGKLVYSRFKTSKFPTEKEIEYFLK